jgi:outer membrane protein assembly factor BamB
MSNYRSVLMTLAVAVVGAICAWAAWSLIQPSDEQNAKLAAAGVIALTTTLVMYLLHRMFRQMGFRWIVPSLAAASLVLFFAIVRLDGFTGEMYPILGWRWSSREIDWQERPAKIENLPIEKPKIDGDAASGISRSPISSQFLGNKRNGIIEKREFSVPQSPDRVEVLWDIGIGGGWASFAIADSLAVTLEQREKDECLTAYDLETGDLRWIVKHPGYHYQAMGGGGPRSTPTIAEGRVFAQTATGIVWCVELKTGDVVWKVDLIKLAPWTLADNDSAITWGRSGSPLVVDGQVILPLGGPTAEPKDESATTIQRSLVSLDARTGEVRWRSGTDQISYASPCLMTLSGVTQIVSVNEQTVTGHRVETGEVLWTFPWFGQTNGGATCASAIPAGNNRLLMGKGYSGGSSLMEISLDDQQQWKVTEVWHSDRFLQTKFNHALVMKSDELVANTGDAESDGSPVAFGIGNGALEAVDLSQPRGLWRQNRKQRCGQGQALLVEDVIVLQTESGPLQFVEASPDEFRLLLELPGLKNKTWNIPVVAGQYVLIRNDQQAMAMKMPKRESN